MTRTLDPTGPIRLAAAAFPQVAKGTSCNQSSFKTDKGAFLFIGPGVKGFGFKAMFKLARSLPEAERLAAASPDRFEVGSTRWVTARFTAEQPLPKAIWQNWLRESYEQACGPGGRLGAKQATPERAAPKRRAKRKARK